MTRLDIMIKAFAAFGGRSEDDLRAFAETNMEPSVRNKLSEEVPTEEADKLLAELKANPSAVFSTFVNVLYGKGKSKQEG